MTETKKRAKPKDDGAGVPPRYMTVRECAGYVRRSEKAIYHLVAAGQIPYRRVNGGRLMFDVVAIDKWIAGSGGVSATEVLDAINQRGA